MLKEKTKTTVYDIKVTMAQIFMIHEKKNSVTVNICITHRLVIYIKTEAAGHLTNYEVYFCTFFGTKSSKRY